jgi:hypothetical protein
MPSESYQERIDALDNVVCHCLEVSRRFAGIPSPTGSHFYASVLFTSLCSRGVSLAIIAPCSPWSKTLVEHWDYASIAGIVRSILEIRLAFFYLCVEECSREEWECRWNIFNLHDCKSRVRIFEEMSHEAHDIASFERQADELRSRLTNNKYFMSLPEKQRNKFLKGGDAYLFPLEEIAVKAGVDRHTFRWLYKLLSIHVHGLPMSFYRMGEQERGRGVHSAVEENYTSLCLSFSVSLLVAARDEMEKLFAGLKDV